MNDGKSDTNEIQNPDDGSTAGSPNQSQSEREDKISPDIPELLQNALNTTPDEKDGQDTSERHVPEASAGREISECNSKSNVKETTSSRDIPAPISNTNPKTDMCGTMATDNRPGEVEPLRPANYYSMSSVGSLACRICHTSEDPERLISPCLCKGTMAYVHRHCLEHWLTTSGMLSCELCNFRFRIEQTLRYSVCQSIRIWYRHPNHRGLLQADFLVCSLLTVVSFGLIGICMLGLQYFVLQGRRMGISRLWTQGSIIVFLVIVAFVYCVNLFLILKSQLVPWYRWWQSVRDIRLILFDRRPIHRLLAKKKPVVASEEVELQSTVLSGQTTAIETRNTTVIAIN